MHEDPFVSISFGDTIRRTFSIFIERADTFLAIASTVLIPFTFILITITAFILSCISTTTKKIVVSYADDDAESAYISPEDREQEEEDVEVHHIGVLIVLVAFDLLLYTVITIIGRGAMIRAVADVYVTHNATNARISWKQCLQSSFQRLFPLWGSNVMISVGLIVIGIVPYIFVIIACVVGGFFSITLAVVMVLGYVGFVVYALISFSLVSPAIIVENKGAKDGLHRSWELADGNRCYIWCCAFCMYVFHQIVTQFLHRIFNSGGAGNVFAFLSNMEGIVISMVPMLVFFPLTTILEAVMYFNIRVQRESLNRDVLVRDLDREVEPSMLMLALGSGGSSTDYNPPDGETSYRQVPLMDKEDDVVAAPVTTRV